MSARVPTPARRAFTMVEILVVIAVLLTVAALSMPVIGMMTARKNEARALQELRQLTVALDAYLGDYPRLGDPAMSASATADFAHRPLHYLIERPKLRRRDPYFEPQLARMADATGAPVATPHEGVRLTDTFRRPLRWAIVDHPDGHHTEAVAVACDRGTADPKDDIIMAWRSEDGLWRRVTWADLTAAEELDPPARTREQGDLAAMQLAFVRERVVLP
ncbi:MAG TPA: type II secretion system protein [Planctomycetota bacterium]|nr:type II secretion system protein [Planctomycetota bacterium]